MTSKGQACAGFWGVDAMSLTHQAIRIECAMTRASERLPALG
jgi:hypothetical protein